MQLSGFLLLLVGLFNVRCTAQTCVDDDSCGTQNHDKEDACPATFGTYSNMTLCYDVADWYEFTNPINQVVEIVINFNGGDTDMQIVDEFNNTVAVGILYNNQLEHVAFNATASTTYYPIVIPFQQIPNSIYSMTISSRPLPICPPDKFEPNNFYWQAANINQYLPNLNLNSSVMSSCDDDWFQFSTTSQFDFYFEVDYNAGVMALDIALYDRYVCVWHTGLFQRLNYQPVEFVERFNNSLFQHSVFRAEFTSVWQLLCAGSARDRLVRKLFHENHPDLPLVNW